MKIDVYRKVCLYASSVQVCVCVFVHVCVFVCMHVRVCVCVHMYVVTLCMPVSGCMSVCH